MFIKHVGKHGDRKVAIVFREVPGEEHMALVTYPDILPMAFHNAVMSAIESDAGQNAESLGEVLFRSLLPDGRAILETLHKEGMIKKVQSSQVIVTPNAKTNIRLDELNKVINEMKTGESAVKKMQELDLNSGMTNNKSITDAAKAMRATEPAPSATTALTDDAIAKQRLAQAEKMELEASGLAAEAQRLKEEAYALDSTLKPKKARVRKVKQNESAQ